MSQLIQIIPWREWLLGLDNEGNVWKITLDPKGNYPILSLWIPRPEDGG